ncbi:PTS sugar transporter subunit IIC [Pediococcus claussenii]|nr:PTS transporter subunit EIIC [Pediococcus claussenii]ANZ70502.1 PTS cellobiose transporter subunit IIC [Pediococcus claussenii]ANZ72317.1 PTS cellobiose transporter subunit IIC [Pediococcus claussenii]
MTTSEKLENSGFIAKFTEISVKVGNWVYLRSLRDAFAIILPVFIIAGLGVLFNNTVFTWLFHGDTLTKVQVFGNAITNGSLNVAGLLVAPMIGYTLAKNKNFNNPIAAAAMSLACLMILMPGNVQLGTVASAGAKMATVTGGLSYLNTGTQGMFGGIIVGLVATSIFMKLASFKHLQIHLGDNIPPAVGASFSVLLPALILMSIFAVIAALLQGFFNTDLINLIKTWIQEPLRGFNTNIVGFCVIYTVANFLFTLGIHQTVISGTLMDPLVLVNMNQNMTAYAHHAAHIPNIITTSFVSNYTLIGGSGGTISLIIAILIFSKIKSSKQVASLSLAPGLFNINEPMIFGFPIVFNLPMMIPFVLFPTISSIIGYTATALGWVSRTVVLVPWTTPPLIGPYLSTAGDWRSVILQALIIGLGVLFYLPFMKISERVASVEASEELTQDDK